jgi:hypothetical protein
MILELPLVLLIISISFYFFRKKKIELSTFIPFLSPFSNYFTTKILLTPSIHQIVSLYSGNTIINELYVIISLSLDFCVSQVLIAPQPSQIVITGHLKSILRPNFYIFKSKFKLKHAGLVYSKKYLLNNISKYQIYGVINKKILDFVSKYDFDIFYCSFVPKIVDTKVFKSQFYLKGSVDLIKNEDFIKDLVDILEERIEDTEKRINDIKKKYLIEFEKFKNEESMGFIEKMKKGVKMRG